MGVNVTGPIIASEYREYIIILALVGKVEIVYTLCTGYTKKYNNRGKC